jgi:taurine transport system substrate-binding protein
VHETGRRLAVWPWRPRTVAPPTAVSRRRVTMGAGALVTGVMAVVLAGLAPCAGAANPSVTLGYFTGSLPTPATVIATTPSLLKTIPATISWSPVTAGVTALAEMEGSSLDSITGVGNPPVVGAIGTGVDVDVLWAVSLTASTLIVPKSITKPSQLAGKTVGDLEGSSTDYQLRGWLSVEHLTTSVTVDGFPSVAAVAAAELSGKLQGAYVNGVQVTQLTGKGGHVLVNSKQIAAVGYGGFGVLAVAHSLIQSDPTLVQDYVCASLAATKDILGSDSAKYFEASANLLGIPPSEAVTAGKADISYYITLKQEKSWLEGSNGSTATGQLTNDYLKTAQFDLSSGRITSIPTRAEVASHIDPTFALHALSGHCS